LYWKDDRRRHEEIRKSKPRGKGRARGKREKPSCRMGFSFKRNTLIGKEGSENEKRKEKGNTTWARLQKRGRHAASQQKFLTRCACKKKGERCDRRREKKEERMTGGSNASSYEKNDICSEKGPKRKRGKGTTKVHGREPSERTSLVSAGKKRGDPTQAQQRWGKRGEQIKRGSTTTSLKFSSAAKKEELTAGEKEDRERETREIGKQGEAFYSCKVAVAFGGKGGASQTSEEKGREKDGGKRSPLRERKHFLNSYHGGEECLTKGMQNAREGRCRKGEKGNVLFLKGCKP